MNLIDERDERTARRKKMKKYFDSKITLATTPEENRKHLSLPIVVSDRPERLRLLDEGSIITADDEVDFYIEKGTLEKFYNNLPDDFVGSINLGHIPFASFPFILGTWTKENIHLVDIGNGRKAIEIDNTIDYESVFVRELLRMPYSIGISAEFAFSVDEKATEEYGLEILNEVFIFAYGLVGEAGNVNSSGIELKGEKMTLYELNKKLGIESVSEEEKPVEEVAAEETPVSEEATAEEETKAEEPTEEQTEDKEQEVAAEEVSEEAPVDEAATDETDKMLSTMAEVIEKLTAKVDTLTEQIVALTADKEAAEKELAIQQEKERKRIEKFKTLYPSLAEEEPVVEEEKTVLKTDGIGEW